MKFYKLIDKKIERCSFTMKKSLSYINTNVEHGRNFKTTLKFIGFSIGLGIRVLGSGSGRVFPGPGLSG